MIAIPTKGPSAKIYIVHNLGVTLIVLCHLSPDCCCASTKLLKIFLCLPFKKKL